MYTVQLQLLTHHQLSGYLYYLAAILQCILCFSFISTKKSAKYKKQCGQLSVLFHIVYPSYEYYYN